MDEEEKKKEGKKKKRKNPPKRGKRGKNLRRNSRDWNAALVSIPGDVYEWKFADCEMDLRQGDGDTNEEF